VSLGLLVAGVVSPRIGRTIQYRGGRPVLAASTVLLAVGLGVLTIAQTLTRRSAVLRADSSHFSCGTGTSWSGLKRPFSACRPN
jgi:uncharacterized membrane protein YidH (DUF202 family)